MALLKKIGRFKVSPSTIQNLHCGYQIQKALIGRYSCRWAGISDAITLLNFCITPWKPLSEVITAIHINLRWPIPTFCLSLTVKIFLHSLQLSAGTFLMNQQWKCPFHCIGSLQVQFLSWMNFMTGVLLKGDGAGHSWRAMPTGDIKNGHGFRG